MIIFTPNTVIKSSDVNLNFSSTIPKYKTIFDEKSASTWSNSSSIYTDITGWTGGSLTTYGGTVILHIEFTYYRDTSGFNSRFRVRLGSNTYFPSPAGYFNIYSNEILSHKFVSRTILLTGLNAQSYTVVLQGANVTTGSVNVDTNDYLRMTAFEIG